MTTAATKHPASVYLLRATNRMNDILSELESNPSRPDIGLLKVYATQAKAEIKQAQERLNANH